MSCRSEKHPMCPCDDVGPFGTCRAKWNAWKLNLAASALDTLPKSAMRDVFIADLVRGVKFEKIK